MNSTLSALKATLSTTSDGAVACNAIKSLGKRARTGSAEAKRILADYIGAGKVNHMRDFACSTLVETLSHDDSEFSAAFEQGLVDPAIRYWCIAGLANTAGKAAYATLVKIAGDQSVPVEDRAQAVKCLATSSKQPFDRQLPDDPGEWDAEDLRLAEIAAWAKAGYPDGLGYASPQRHPALDRPKSAFEKLVSRLDKQLAKKRKEQDDLADPANWLAVADPRDLAQVTARWTLPSTYVDFLTRFSPIQVTLQNRRFMSGLQLYGAKELVDGQNGYSFNPVTNKVISKWPKHLVVIANDGGNPFVLDLSQSDGAEAPVLTAEHGSGPWNFVEFADSFAKFLQILIK